MSFVPEELDIRFTWYDYLFFGLVLLLSALVGVYFGFYKKQQTPLDYLFGGKTMSVFPVAMSLIANNISGISLLAVPSDIYRYGMGYWFTVPVISAVVLIANKTFISVLYRLQITSIFEYLKLRFDTRTRLLGSIMNSISNITFLPIVIYVPSLALAQATGFHVHIISCILCSVCIFYTTVGGLKAVVYSDSIQFVIMIGSLGVVFFLGLASAGGFTNVWNTSYNNDRLSIPLEFDLTKRDSIWTATIGMFVMWSSYMIVNQVLVQKCLTLPTDADVTKMLIIFVVGFGIILTVCCFTGLIIYTIYVDCDPLSSGWIQAPDQLLPLYVMEVAKQIPGLAGLFTVGVFCAALSTLSSGLNSLSGNIYEDFISSRMPDNITEKKTSNILKVIVCILGITCTCLVLIVEKLGGILALTYSLSGATSGPALGLFFSGMVIPKVNSRGAFYGGTVSLAVMLSIVGGTQWIQSQNSVIYPTLPLSVEGCVTNRTENLDFIMDINATSDTNIETFALFRISYYWYTSLGFILYLLVAVFVSIFIKGEVNITNKDFFLPIVQRFLLVTPPPVYCSIEKALNVLEISDNK